MYTPGNLDPRKEPSAKGMRRYNFLSLKLNTTLRCSGYTYCYFLSRVMVGGQVFEKTYAPLSHFNFSTFKKNTSFNLIDGKL